MPELVVHRRRHVRPWQWATLAGAAALVALLILAAASVPFSSSTLRARLVGYLSDRLDSEVELGDLQLRAFPRFHAVGTTLVVRYHRRHDVPPLVAIDRFEVEADLIGLVRKHVSRVALTGLAIQIPPDHNDTGEDQAPVATIGDTAAAPTDQPGTAPTSPRPGAGGMLIDTLVSDDARFVTLPSDPEDAPKTWNIHHLTMHGVGVDAQMPYQATLTNAVPPGEIQTDGHFGPWQREHPGRTPIDGRFTFDHADLGVFHGIAGTLSARGTFGGVLGRLDIHGETDTPDFLVRVGNQAVPLHTKYHAVVDGTNGDTRLERVDATFLNTSLAAKGEVVDTPGREGRTVALDVEISKGRLEDVLKLAVKAKRAPMTGGITLKTKFLLPPGERDVADRLHLNGRFAIDGARFTDFDVQRRINELSHRGRGEAPTVSRAAVLSDFAGQFVLARGTLALPALTFAVPGAQVRLAGRYGLRSETLDFTGNLDLAARISDTQTGFKRILLKIADPWFRKKGGGSTLPIKISGQRESPQFGLDVKRALLRR